MTAPTGYRPCVGIALFNQVGKVFLGRRAGVTDGFAWQLPQGGIDADETPLAAAVRELAEEANVTSATLLDQIPVWLTYELPADAIKPSWRGRYVGQAQRWFAFRFEGNDDEIDVLNPTGGHKPEFDDWRWADLAEAPDLIVPFKREVYRQVAILFAGFANLNYRHEN